MAETLQNGLPDPAETRGAWLVNAAEVARETTVRQSPNGVCFATFGETGVADLDLSRILEAVPAAITSALSANTYYFVPLALREASVDGNADGSAIERPDVNGSEVRDSQSKCDAAMVARAYTDEFSDAAICHRNVELGQGKRGVFISTRLMGDRFALSFEFFINVAHAFVETAGIPAGFSDLVWKQASDNVRGETSVDAWESRNLAFGRPANSMPEPLQPVLRRNRSAFASFSARERSFAGPGATHATVAQMNAGAETGAEARSGVDEKARETYLQAAASDAIAIYLLSLALDFDYSELREREYPLLAPAALACRLRLIAELFPPSAGYEFSVRYRRRA